MKAVVLAGGRGTRLRPYTAVLPKPLMPVGDYPILEILIRQLKRAGCSEAVLAVGYLAQLIEAYFGDGSQWGLPIRYSRESAPHGTAGPIALVDNLDGAFLVMNGDVLTSLDLGAFYAFHCSRSCAATVALCRRSVKLNLGVIRADEAGHLREYIEKPSLDYQVSMGIYAFGADVLSYIPRGGYLDLPDLIRALVADGRVVQVYPFDGLWLDIGNPDDYERASEIFAQDPGAFLGAPPA